MTKAPKKILGIHWLLFTALVAGLAALAVFGSYWRRNHKPAKAQPNLAITANTANREAPVNSGEKPDRHEREAAKHAFLKACEHHDAKLAANKLMHWAQVVWPEQVTVSLLDIAGQVEKGADEIRDLHRYLYQPSVGGAAHEWSGAELADALRGGLKPKSKNKKDDGKQGLPPLYPA